MRIPGEAEARRVVVAHIDLRHAGRVDDLLAIPADAEVQRHALRRLPRVVREEAVAQHAALRERRRLVHERLARRAVHEQRQRVGRAAESVERVDHQVPHDLAAELEVVIAAPAALRVAERPVHLRTAAIERDVVHAARDEVVAGVLDPWRRALARAPPDRLVRPCAHFEQQRAREHRVVFELPDARRKMRVPHRIRVHDRGRRAAAGNLDRAEVIRLVLVGVLEVDDRFLRPRHVVGDLPRPHRHPRLLHVVDERRIPLSARRPAVRAVPPQLVLRHEAAEIDVEVLERAEAVRVDRGEHVAAGDARRELRGVDVVRLHRVVLVVGVERAVVRVAAGLRDELAEHAGVGHLGGVADGVDGDLGERSVVGVVEIAAAAARSLVHHDAFDDAAVDAAAAREAVRGVGLLRERAAAADVDARHRDGRRLRDDRPEIARSRQAREPLAVEMRRHVGRLQIDDRRRAADGDRFGDRARAHLDVDRRREAEADVNARARDRSEAGELERERVLAGREVRQTEEAVLIAHGRGSAHDGGTGDGDGDAGKDGLRRVGDGAVDRTGRRAHRLRVDRGRGQQQRARERRTRPGECHDTNLPSTETARMGTRKCKVVNDPAR